MTDTGRGGLVEGNGGEGNGGIVVVVSMLFCLVYVSLVVGQPKKGFRFHLFFCLSFGIRLG
jgi:hypothetical protein